MKNMFLTSSFADVADLFVKFTSEKCVGKTVTFIPTASLVEDVNFYVAAGRETLEKCGLIVDELEISTAPSEEVNSKLQKNDYIYVTGGNTFFLLQELKRTGADQFIKEQISSGKMYIGESAGSIVMSPYIEYVKDMDDFTAAPNLDSFSSLNMVDFYPVPHHTNVPFKQVVEKIITSYDDKIDLCPISNTQAIIINGDEFEVWTAET
ncbi:peptidase E [Vreelandella venusta]|uniref:peptidase E n=1 Tax=Vreelandella venusta TaxID=44935 RepID=UPI0018DA906E|nr:Type 1 glutamine amidotransferase-like domain-containing protein [Halomonas venusta]QPI65674.1 Type 1 glutamine amidotransferase-like domain-containing protein [Halomonas venusta]WAM50068.1 Type 1 glutamine amidotransferase-like domain-containing protein [Halomonas venusta]WAM53554.1 Type 1 glutamine amidotransferase-like domain-containing protein [Halomonas venusta]WAM57097.1 Type 1 glutamine amidotransferase-like domain-containing protein [Halomonas venusta]